MVERKRLILEFYNLLGLCTETMGSRGQKLEEQMTQIILPLAGPRNYRRKKRYAWQHSDKSRKRLPRLRPCTEAVRYRVRPPQHRTTPCNSLGLLHRS